MVSDVRVSEFGRHGIGMESVEVLFCAMGHLNLRGVPLTPLFRAVNKGKLKAALAMNGKRIGLYYSTYELGRQKISVFDTGSREYSILEIMAKGRVLSSELPPP